MKSILSLILLSLTYLLAGATKPNILLILVDDMSVYGISSYGNKPWKTPHIDGLAEKGMKWTNAYAYPVCSPTRSALLTGRNTIHTGITNWIPGWFDRTENPALVEQPFANHLALSEYTLAEALRDYGYQTALVGKWHLGDHLHHKPVQQGFDTAYSITSGNTGNYFVQKDGMNFLSFSGQDQPGHQFITEHFADQAIHWLKQRNEQPWFLYFSTHVVHKPNRAKEEKINKFRKAGLSDDNPDSATYAAMHDHMDEAIGRLLDYVREQNMEKDTIIVFLSDNGGREPETDNRPLQGGKGELLEGGIRIPLIFQWPGHIPASSSTDRLTVVDDLYPTLLDLAGLPLPKDIEFDGISLADTLRGKKSGSNKRTIFFHYPHYTANPYGEPSSAVRYGKWKLIHLLKDDMPELYNLVDDPGEARNVASRNPEIRDRLWKALKKWKEENDVPELEHNPHYDASKPTLWNGELQAKGTD